MNSTASGGHVRDHVDFAAKRLAHAVLSVSNGLNDDLVDIAERPGNSRRTARAVTRSESRLSDAVSARADFDRVRWSSGSSRSSGRNADGCDKSSTSCESPSGLHRRDIVSADGYSGAIRRAARSPWSTHRRQLCDVERRAVVKRHVRAADAPAGAAVVFPRPAFGEPGKRAAVDADVTCVRPSSVRMLVSCPRPRSGAGDAALPETPIVRYRAGTGVGARSAGAAGRKP